MGLLKDSLEPKRPKTRRSSLSVLVHHSSNQHSAVRSTRQRWVITCFICGHDGLQVSYIYYVDDTVILCEANEELIGISMRPLDALKGLKLSY